MKDQLLQDLMAEFGDTLSESEIMEIMQEAEKEAEKQGFMSGVTDKLADKGMDALKRYKEFGKTQLGKYRDEMKDMTPEEQQRYALKKGIAATGKAAVGIGAAGAAVGLGALAYKKYKAKKAAQNAEARADETEYLSDSMEFVLDQLHDGKELSECTILLTEGIEGFSIEEDVVEFLMEAAEMDEDEVIDFLTEAAEKDEDGNAIKSDRKLLSTGTKASLAGGVAGAGAAGAAVGLGALAYKAYKAKKAKKAAEQQEEMSESLDLLICQLDEGFELSECVINLTEDVDGDMTVDADVVEFLMEAAEMDEDEVIDFLNESKFTQTVKNMGVNARENMIDAKEWAQDKTKSVSSTVSGKMSGTKDALNVKAKYGALSDEDKKKAKIGAGVGAGAVGAVVGLSALAYKKHKAKKAKKEAEQQEEMSESLDLLICQLDEGFELSECVINLTEDVDGFDVAADVVEFLAEATGMEVDEVLEFLAEARVTRPGVSTARQYGAVSNKTQSIQQAITKPAQTQVAKSSTQTSAAKPAPKSYNISTPVTKRTSSIEKALSNKPKPLNKPVTQSKPVTQTPATNTEIKSDTEATSTPATNTKTSLKDKYNNLSKGKKAAVGAGVAGAAVGLGALAYKKYKAKKAAQNAENQEYLSDSMEFVLDQLNDGTELSECTILLGEGVCGNLSVEEDVVEFLMEATGMDVEDVLDFLTESTEVKQVLPGNGIVEMTSDKAMSKIQSKQSVDVDDVKGKQAQYTLPGNGIKDVTVEKDVYKVQAKQSADLSESTEYDVYAESFYGDHLINEAILTDTHVNLTEGEMATLVSENLLSERSIVRLDKEARRSQAEQKALVVIAREQNDPLYHKLIKVYKQKRTILDALDKKYGTRAVSRVRSNAKKINKDKE